MRAHNLASTALNEILLEYVEEEDRYAIEAASELFVSLQENNDTPLDAGALKDSPIVQNLIEVVGRAEKDLSLGTNILFLEYLKMYDILYSKTYIPKDWVIGVNICHPWNSCCLILLEQDIEHTPDRYPFSFKKWRVLTTLRNNSLKMEPL